MGYEYICHRNDKKATHRAAAVFEAFEVPELKILAVADNCNADCYIRKLIDGVLSTIVALQLTEDMRPLRSNGMEQLAFKEYLLREIGNHNRHSFAVLLLSGNTYLAIYSGSCSLFDIRSGKDIWWHDELCWKRSANTDHIALKMGRLYDHDAIILHTAFAEPVLSSDQGKNAACLMDFARLEAFLDQTEDASAIAGVYFRYQPNGREDGPIPLYA